MAHMKDNTNKRFGGKHEGKTRLKYLHINGRIKITFKETRQDGVDWTGSGQKEVVGYFEHDKE
jgi:hypothetical protein